MKKLVLLMLILMSSASFASDCYQSYIKKPVPFNGNSGDIVVLDDNSIWEIGFGEYNYLYEYQPNVLVCPSKEVLIITGGSSEPKKISAKKIAR